MWHRVSFILKQSHGKLTISYSTKTCIFSLDCIYSYYNSNNDINADQYLFFLKSKVRLLLGRNPPEWLFECCRLQTGGFTSTPLCIVADVLLVSEFISLLLSSLFTTINKHQNQNTWWSTSTCVWDEALLVMRGCLRLHLSTSDACLSAALCVVFEDIPGIQK